MVKQKSKEKSREVKIKPEQVRDALETAITARDYRKTTEFKAEAEKKLEEFNKTFGPHIERYKEMAKEINERLSSSGFFETIKKTQEVYSRFIKDCQPPEIVGTFIFPEKRSHIILTNEDINLISEKAAEKIFEKLDKQKTTSQSTKKKIIALNIPQNTRWENITIKILNENNITILIGNNKYETSYKKMGFNDNRKNCPNKQWWFLIILATRNGSIAWEDFEKDDKISKLSLKDINKFKKTKQLLAKSLRDYFKIEDDPFYSYKKEKAYKIRINLIGSIN